MSIPISQLLLADLAKLSTKALEKILTAYLRPTDPDYVRLRSCFGA